MSIPTRPSAAAAVVRRADWLPRAVGRHAHLVRFAERAAWPPLDLAIRLWLAHVFFVSGVVKLMSWQTALNLAATEYPVSWMDPVAAAYTGATIEVVGPVLLAAGLFTRPAAFAMLLLALVEQFCYLPFDSQLLWAAFCGWYVVMGAGRLSLDHAFKGLAGSALPLAAPVLRAAAWVRHVLGPLYLLALRLWVAAALAAPALVGRAGLDADALMRARLWLPWHSAPQQMAPFALATATLLAAGLATRYVAVVVWLGVGVTSMMDLALTADLFWVLLLALLAVLGGGRWSTDGLLARFLRRRFPELDGKPAFDLEGLPRVVIVGAGFGGLTCAAALARTRVAVTLIDRANHHLFQPLLYQVATAGLSPGDIAAPVRPMMRDSFNTRVLFGTVTGIDAAARAVLVGDQRLPYDYLVLATGATHAYFGRDDWAPFAPGLKRIEDATEIRRRLLTAFEKAEAAEDEAERAALLTFLVVGGGPTGVELAGAIAELARFGMEKDFRRFDPATTRVVLVQSGPRVLPTFPEALSAIAKASLERLGVEVRLGSRVELIDAEGVMVSGQRIAARTVLWAAGVAASPAAGWLGAAADGAGRIKVEPDLTVIGFPEVYAIGDTAASTAWNGQPVPGLAPAAKQGGAYVARHIRARIDAAPPPAPFRYRHMGSLATIGRKAAVVDFGRVRLWGAPAWWLWGLVHVGLLVGVRNRITTVVNWFWAYLTFRSAVRLITGSDPPARVGAAGVAAPR
jgi:NADH dehydrogenase/putative oxidoreductase